MSENGISYASPNNSMQYIEKLKILFGLKLDAELAKLLGVTPSTLSSWKNQDTFDTDVVFKKFPEISPNWLVYSIGSPYLKEELNQIKENETQYELYKQNEKLKAELKKIEAKISTERAEIGDIGTQIHKEVQNIPSEISELIRLKEENKLLLEVVNKLSAKLI